MEFAPYWFLTNNFPGNCFTNRFISRLNSATDTAELGRLHRRITSSDPNAGSTASRSMRIASRSSSPTPPEFRRAQTSPGEQRRS